MKHIKAFEEIDLSGAETLRERKSSLVALYLEEIIPVTEEDGFIECLYDDTPNIFSFYFHNWTDDENYNKFYKFLKDNRLKIKNERPSGDMWELNVIISDYKMNVYSQFMEDKEKYNI